MVHAACSTPKEFSETKPLSLDQFNTALSTSFKNFRMVLPNPLWLIKLLEDGAGEINYQTLGQHQYINYTHRFKNWPYVDKAKNVKASKALLIFRENEFHAGFNARGYSFCLPNVNQINDRFVQKDSRDGSSLCGKHSIKNDEVHKYKYKFNHITQKTG